MFYLPKILWDQFEQGRMNKICNEILSITKISKDYSKKVKEVADKVTKYIKLEQAGHFLYGIGYLCSQVRMIKLGILRRPQKFGPSSTFYLTLLSRVNL